MRERSVLEVHGPIAQKLAALTAAGCGFYGGLLAGQVACRFVAGGG